ncbi:MAG: septum formation initiator family protein [Thermoleophilaceae bacterium]|nr:septum formation initiator family protein [Thermoleophilaceae bacterium]
MTIDGEGEVVAAASRSRARNGSGGTIRWDRVGRYALLAVLCGILALYVGPLTRWHAQSENAERHRGEVAQLEREHQELQRRVEALSDPTAIEVEARRLGMVRRGETLLSIEPAKP